MKKRFVDDRLWRNILVGLGVGVVLIFFGTLTGAYLIYKEIVGADSVGYIAVLIVLLSGITATVMASRGNAGKKQMMISSLTGICLWIVLLGINLVVFANGFSGVWITGVLFLVSGFASFLLFGKTVRKIKYRIPKT